MTWRHYIALFSVGLIVSAIVAYFERAPGYLDADYYYAGALQIFDGKGFTEPYLWNYLDDPSGLPHPSHTYWMPLASIVSALGMFVTQQRTYSAGRLAFLLISAWIPLVTAAVAESISRQPRIAMVAGLLSIFSLFYTPFMPALDNYAIFMVLGGIYFLVLLRPKPWFWLGIISGLLTLARSDGLLWLGLTGLSVFLNHKRKPDESLPSFLSTSMILPAGIFTLLGYFLVMGGWHVRNLILFGTPFAPGGGHLLWMQNYFETYIYPVSELSRESFLRAGWKVAIENRAIAFVSNIFVAGLAQGEIFFSPLIVIGLINLRRDLRARLAVIGWLTLFTVMTFIFPLASPRGSFFHAGSAFQPFWWVMVPMGLDVVIDKVRKRGRLTENANAILSSGMVILAIILTAHLVFVRLIANNWPKHDGNYAAVEEMLVDNGCEPDDIVIVWNPPGYYIASNRSAIVIPYGDESKLLAVARKYDAHYLVLENHAVYDAIRTLYDFPQQNPAFQYLGETYGARLYRIEFK